MSALLALVIGLTAIFLEFYLPGGIMGLIGGALILLSLILFNSSSQSLTASIFFIIFVILCVILVIKLALWRFQASKSATGFNMNQDQEGYYASSYDTSCIGKIGIVVSDLKPGGHILIDGIMHQAISVEGYLSKGSEVLVVSGEGESLIVKKKKDEIS